MLIDGDKLIAEQLNLKAGREVVFPDGRKTRLSPVACTPRLVDEALTLFLDGEWQVARWPFAKLEGALVALKTRDRTWETVAQPGKVFGLDVRKTAAQYPNYNRVGLDHIDPEDGAVLRRTVRIPRTWKGKRIHLRFDSIYPAGRVYLNGALLGEHLSGLTPVEFDVTEKVTPGQETLVALRLLRRHKFVKMDMPRHGSEFAGLAQSACFFATEPCCISDYALVSALDPALSRGEIAGTIDVTNHGPTPFSGRLTVSLALPDGKKVAAFATNVKVPAGSRTSVRARLTLRNPQLWNDEFPNLYQATVSLRVRGQALQEIAYRTGFRRFEFKDSRPLLNGHPVKFRGVNHLSYHPESGLYTPEAWLRQNLALMKKANVNAIRTHYLGPRCLAELCDELGIYLLQELPIDWGTNYIADVEWVGPALQRLAGGVLRDRHHPSVMVWSVGNENMPESAAVADDGWNHLRLYDRFVKTLDPSRPTMFPPPGPANKVRGIFEVRVGDIGDTHYSFNLAKDFLKTGTVTNPRAWTGEMETTTRAEAIKRGWSGVWFSSEYGIMNMMPDLLNAPYNSIIDDVSEEFLSGKNSLQVFIDRLRREWGFMRNEPTCLGGAFFPWICGAAGDNPWGWVVWAEDNDWGPVTADLLPKPFFWGMRVLFSPVWFPERVTVKPGATVIRFEVTNQYNAIDFADCTLRTLMGWGGWVAARDWRDIPVSCPPGETRTIEIPLWNPSTQEAMKKGVPSVLRVYLLDPKGFRPITADILLIPEKDKEQKPEKLRIGPDAEG